MVDMLETVPCQFCGKPTRMTGTKQCDACWQLATSMRGVAPTVLRRITKFLADENKQDESGFRKKAIARMDSAALDRLREAHSMNNCQHDFNDEGKCRYCGIGRQG